MKRLLSSLVFAASMLLGHSTHAAVIVGGISFDNNAFADSLGTVVGSWTYGGGATSLTDALTGSNPADYAFCFGSTCSVQINFDDNMAVNGSDTDIAIFELGNAETFAVQIGATTRSYTAVDTGMDAGGFNLLVALIDLTDFGIGVGATISSLTLFPAPTGGDPADFTVIGATNNSSVPEPATLALFGLGLAGLGAMRRKKLAA
jgi:hypothetical protein